MKFSPRKRAKLRKVRYDRNKKSWSGYGYRNVDGEPVIDKIFIEQKIYLLTKANRTYNIFRVGGNGELTKLTPKKILGNRGAFQRADKWVENTTVKIDDNGNIVKVEKPKEEPVALRAILILS